MSKNDVTGDEIKSRISSKAYEEGHDRIFGNMKATLTGKTAFMDSYEEVESPVEAEALADGFLYWTVFDFEVAINKYGVSTVLNQLKPETIEAIQYAITSGRSSP